MSVFYNPWVNLMLFFTLAFLGGGLFYRELKTIKTKDDFLIQLMRFFTSASMLWPGLLLIFVSLFFLSNFFKLNGA